MLLPRVCDIQIGHTSRGGLDFVRADGLRAVQLRDVGDGRIVEIASLPFVDLDDVADRYLARPGDLVFRTRGERTTAAMVTGEPSDVAAVILPLVLLRPDSRAVLPEYLAWAINQPAAQNQLNAHAQGQTVRMVPRKALDTLDIPIPDLATQRAVAAAADLAAREEALAHRLADLRRMRLDALLDVRVNA